MKLLIMENSEVMNMTVEERIAQLRKLMAERKIDVYYMPNEDDHLSEEYTASYFHAKSWMSGFSQKAGAGLGSLLISSLMIGICLS